MPLAARRLTRDWKVAACSGLARVPAAWMIAEMSCGEYRYGTGRCRALLLAANTLG
jgi:hypothetical protein